MSYIWSSHVPRMNASHVYTNCVWSFHFWCVCHIYVTCMSGTRPIYFRVMPHAHMRYFSHIKESSSAYERVTCMHESCVVPPIWRICHICVTRISGSCRTCWRVMSHSRMRYVSHVYESGPANASVTRMYESFLDIFTSHVSLTYEICITYERVGSRIWMRHTYVCIICGPSTSGVSVIYVSHI